MVTDCQSQNLVWVHLAIITVEKKIANYFGTNCHALDIRGMKLKSRNRKRFNHFGVSLKLFI